MLLKIDLQLLLLFRSTLLSAFHVYGMLFSCLLPPLPSYRVSIATMEYSGGLGNFLDYLRTAYVVGENKIFEPFMF